MRDPNATRQKSAASSIDSGFTKAESVEDEPTERSIKDGELEDESIAWLQQRIEAMNQTLEAYECPGKSFNKDWLDSLVDFNMFKNKLL